MSEHIVGYTSESHMPVDEDLWRDLRAAATANAANNDNPASSAWPIDDAARREAARRAADRLRPGARHTAPTSGLTPEDIAAAEAYAATLAPRPTGPSDSTTRDSAIEGAGAGQADGISGVDVGPTSGPTDASPTPPSSAPAIPLPEGTTPEDETFLRALSTASEAADADYAARRQALLDRMADARSADTARREAAQRAAEAAASRPQVAGGVVSALIGATGALLSSPFSLAAAGVRAAGAAKQRRVYNRLSTRLEALDAGARQAQTRRRQLASDTMRLRQTRVRLQRETEALNLAVLSDSAAHDYTKLVSRSAARLTHCDIGEMWDRIQDPADHDPVVEKLRAGATRLAANPNFTTRLDAVEQLAEREHAQAAALTTHIDALTGSTSYATDPSDAMGAVHDTLAGTDSPPGLLSRPQHGRNLAKLAEQTKELMRHIAEAIESLVQALRQAFHFAR